MAKILGYDYCAFAILLILFLTTLLKKMNQGRLNRTYLYMLVIGLITSTIEIIYVMIASGIFGSTSVAFVLQGILMVIRCSYLILYMIYLLILSDTDAHMKGNKWKQILFSLPFFLMIVLVSTNYFHRGVYYFDADGGYHTGPFIYLLYLIGAMYIGSQIIHIIRYRNLFGKQNAHVLFGVIFIVCITSVIQKFFPNIRMEMFGYAVSMLILSTTIQSLEHFLDTDTGFGKRSLYVEDMGRAMKAGKRKSVIMVNVQNFFSLQEVLGYTMAMNLVHDIALEIESINHTNRYKAELYYLGQGKYRIVLDEKQKKFVDSFADDIQKLFSSLLNYNGMDINTIFYICIVRCPEDISDIETLMAFGHDINNLKFTGAVEYAEKVFQKERYDILMHIDAIIEDAIVNHKFEVYYQPIYSVAEKRFRSAEALLRLKTEAYGFISPDMIIPAAEKSGAICYIGSFVLEEVCKFIASEDFEKSGLEYIEVNLSVIQCMHTSFCEEVMSLLNKYHVTPDKINLEITETVAANSQHTLLNNIRELTKCGIDFSLDDFGTGYSNMSRIASMPFHLVKLDKSFTNLERNDKLEIVLQNTIRMIKDMNMQIVVEGIETENMVDLFTNMNCEYIQGYFYSKPLPKEEFIRFVTEKNHRAIAE